MKKSLIFALAMAVFALPALSSAAEFRVGEQPSVRAEESVSDLYIAGGSVTSVGNVVGDIVAVGGNVVISGAVSADVMAAGGNVTVLSAVADDVRAGGGNVVIQGRVGGDLILAGGQITVGGSGVIGDVAIAGGNIRIDAPIGGSLKIGGGDVYLNAPIVGNIQIDADRVTLGSNAVITGNLKYKAGKELVKEEGALVNGAVNFEPRPERKVASATWLAGLASLWFLGKFLTLFVSALLVGLTFRRYSRMLVAKATERPLLELGRGLLLIVALPILSVLAMFTVVGFPLGLLGLFGFIIVLIFAWMVTPILVGSLAHKFLLKGDGEISWKSILLGAVLCVLIGMLPLVGTLALMLLTLLMLGASAAIKWEVMQEWK